METPGDDAVLRPFSVRGMLAGRIKLVKLMEPSPGHAILTARELWPTMEIVSAVRDDDWEEVIQTPVNSLPKQHTT